jgi:triosephosphate isomerase
MRKPFVAGNWKMNNTVSQTRDLVLSLAQQLAGLDAVERVICPPYTALMAAAAMLEGTGIGLGAQNMHWEPKGAYTGEVSAAMLKENCAYVILGHSERRAYFNESDEIINRKLQAALSNELIPIFCIGETLAEYESGRTRSVLEQQMRQGLKDIKTDKSQQLVLAYEPVWAIGTGRASTAENANSVVSDIIRPLLAESFGKEASLAIRVLYGGSVTAANADEFFLRPDIDGALVGGASLKVDEFTAITQAASRRIAL